MSRELMKEFRTLRDLRHDNINSFIGKFFLLRASFLFDFAASWFEERKKTARHFDVN